MTKIILRLMLESTIRRVYTVGTLLLYTGVIRNK